MAANIPRPTPPDGIGAEHVRPSWTLGRHASPLSLLLLGAVLAAGMSGFAGGGPRTEMRVRNAEGEFTVLAPTTTRNGDILETRFSVLAQERIGKLVIGVQPSLWRQMTTNSTVPQAAEESYGQGLVRFSFAALEPGESFEFQVAQQINPDLVGRNRGRIVFLDDQRPLAEIAAQLTVLP